MSLRASKLLLVFIILAFSFTTAFAQRPKIGLALSGGGAKGLVHIGILQAIDSAGLKIDYISGTSMGSIVGAMYAVGYNADTIETIARNLDWDKLLTNRTTIETTPIENKSEYGRYIVSLPIDKKGVRIRGGVIESQELWLKLHEIFQPAYGITDFSKLNIPFSCVATDLKNGKAVILTKGDLIQSIRASMALPSIFTPVAHEDTKLIDGGIVENFPVTEVINMGANYVIGVSVSEGLEKIEKINTPFAILQQVAFFKDADNFQNQRKKCNVYIQPDLGDFTGGSFASADSIISIGIAEGKKYYPIFKRIADSLNAKVPTEILKNRLVPIDSLYISGIDVTGLKKTNYRYFTNRLNLGDSNRKYCVKDINAAIRNMHVTEYYDRLTYVLEADSVAKNKVKLKIAANENPTTFFKMGLHYASYSKIALIANIVQNNFISPGTSGSLKINISENFRALGQTHSYLDRYNTTAIKVSAYFEDIKKPRYRNFRLAEVYNNVFAQFGIDYYKYYSHKFFFTGGLGYTIESYSASVSLFDYDNSGVLSYFATRAGIGYHSLNKSVFPTKGGKIELQGSFIFNQNANSTYPKQMYKYLNVTDSVLTTLKGYQRLIAKAEKYTSLNRKFTLINKLQVGANFNFDKLYGNNFLVGGLIDYNRNQIMFSGFRDANISTASILVATTGLQYDINKSLLITAEFATGLNNFIKVKHDIDPVGQWLRGMSFSVGYNSSVLPVYLSAMYNSETHKIMGNINVGFHF